MKFTEAVINIRESNLKELDEIMSSYNMMCGELGKAYFLPEGNKGGFPPKGMVIGSIKHTQLYVGVEDSKIMAAYIMNNEVDTAYDKINWQIDVPKEKVSILHVLRVSPVYGGKGYASRLVEHSIEKAVRYTTGLYRGKSISHKMYQSHGLSILFQIYQLTMRKNVSRFGFYTNLLTFPSYGMIDIYI